MGGRVIPARCEQRAGRRFVGRKWTLPEAAGPCRPCSNDQQQASSSAYAVSADSAPAYRLWRTQRQQAREALDRVADQTGAVVVPAPGAAGGPCKCFRLRATRLRTMARTTYRATWAAPNHGGALTPSRMAHMVTVTGNSLVLFALQLVDQVTRAFIVLVAQSFPERDARQ